MLVLLWVSHVPAAAVELMPLRLLAMARAAEAVLVCQRLSADPRSAVKAPEVKASPVAMALTQPVGFVELAEAEEHRRTVSMALQLLEELAAMESFLTLPGRM